MKTIASIVGARPQFIKCAPVSRELRKHFREYLIHTGQHYDCAMSEIFFNEMQIPEPDVNLGIGSGSHGYQTGQILTAIEATLLEIQPALVLIYGDTNSTLAGALAAAKLQLPVAHVEAGLRSFNRQMPEEINRIIADTLSKYLFAPTPTAVKNLNAEGFNQGIYLTGDVMYDAFLSHQSKAQQSNVLARLKITAADYILTTIHRPQNTDDIDWLTKLLAVLNQLDSKVIFPVHPRTKNRMAPYGFQRIYPKVQFIEPVSYTDMLFLESSARVIITDSGGVQKEAFFSKVPCLILRSETEWVELVDGNFARLCSGNLEQIPAMIADFKFPEMKDLNLYGSGKASQAIATILKQVLS
jgi:UDP-N-acetylglucosamine 2-epimerase